MWCEAGESTVDVVADTSVKPIGALTALGVVETEGPGLDEGLTLFVLGARAMSYNAGLSRNVQSGSGTGKIDSAGAAAYVGYSLSCFAKCHKLYLYECCFVWSYQVIF